jgi:hypothetical protein
MKNAPKRNLYRIHRSAVLGSSTMFLFTPRLTLYSIEFQSAATTPNLSICCEKIQDLEYVPLSFLLAVTMKQSEFDAILKQMGVCINPPK